MEVRKDGAPINKASVYTVAVNNFLAGGGDNFLAFKNGLNQVPGPIDLDVLVQYLSGLSAPITVTIDGRITVVP